MVRNVQQDGLPLSLWRGTKSGFKKLLDDGLIKDGTIYFVGDSDEYGVGFMGSSNGVIYVGKSERKAVRFGSYSSKEDIDKILKEISEELNKKTETKEYASFDLFPETGKSGNVYVDLSTSKVYMWNGDEYFVFGGYSAGNGIDITDGVITNTHTNISDDELNDILKL